MTGPNPRRRNTQPLRSPLGSMRRRVPARQLSRKPDRLPDPRTRRRRITSPAPSPCKATPNGRRGTGSPGSRVRNRRSRKERGGWAIRVLMIRSPDDPVRHVHCSLCIQRGSARPMIVVAVSRPKYRPSRESLDRRFMRKTSPTPMRWQPCQTGNGRPRRSRSSPRRDRCHRR